MAHLVVLAVLVGLFALILVMVMLTNEHYRPTWGERAFDVVTFLILAGVDLFILCDYFGVI